MIFILTTCKNTAEAKRIATALLRLRLVACAKWWPIASSYWWTPLEKSRPVAAEAVPLAGRSLTGWKGKLVAGREVLLLLEARKTHWKKIRAAIRRLHSYETPCILAIKCSHTDPAYHQWLHNVVT